MSPFRLERILRSDDRLRAASRRIASVLPADVEGTPYDTRAAAYDRVVGSWIYNRVVWGSSPGAYRAFARQALNSGSGPLLDAGSGSAVFTARAHVRSSRPVLLVDRSLGMLAAARDRIEREAGGQLPDTVALLQADAEDLPLADDSVETVLSMGMLHLFEDLTGHVEHLLRPLAPGGSLFATCLVTDRAGGRQYLRLLHRAGEVATPRSFATLREVFSTFDLAVDAEREGNMVFLKTQKPGPPE